MTMMLIKPGYTFCSIPSGICSVYCGVLSSLLVTIFMILVVCESLPAVALIIYWEQLSLDDLFVLLRLISIGVIFFSLSFFDDHAISRFRRWINLSSYADHLVLLFCKICFCGAYTMTFSLVSSWPEIVLATGLRWRLVLSRTRALIIVAFYHYFHYLSLKM